jgi:hypothetical protein
MAELPQISECKSIKEVHSQSMAINRMATDLVSEPIVQEGYIAGGQNANVVFVNVQAMAKKRLGAIFPTADWKDPIYERLLMEARLIAAECIHLKYECRARRQPYDHLMDCTKRIQKMVRDNFLRYSETIKALPFEAPDADSESSTSNG